MACAQEAAYDGTTVFMTGATGFLGKVVMEKILWSLRGVKKLYILLRNRKDCPAQDRLATEILSWQCFDRLREGRPDFESAPPAAREAPLPPRCAPRTLTRTPRFVQV